jgi:Tfp pilus assembly protein PilF
MGNLIVIFAAAVVAHSGSAQGVVLNARGNTLYQSERYAEAERIYRQAIEAFGETPSVSRAITRENLGIALRAQGRLGEAEELLVQALVEVESLTGPRSVETGQVANNLATVYLGQHRFENASKLLRSLVENTDDHTAATAYGNLAAGALGLGDNVQAEQYARRALELAGRALPAGDRYRAVILNNLAQACRFNGKYLEAEQLYREAISIWETALGPANSDLGRGLMNLAAFYHDRGREAGAEQLYLRAAEILEPADPLTATVVRNELADVLRAELRYTEAAKLARATLPRLEADLPASDPRLIRARDNWARLERETHRVRMSRSLR